MKTRRKHKLKRGASIHQKQLRFWTILAVLVVMLLFTLIFYFFNKWLTPNPH